MQSTQRLKRIVKPADFKVDQKKPLRKTLLFNLFSNIPRIANSIAVSKLAASSMYFLFASRVSSGGNTFACWCHGDARRISRGVFWSQARCIHKRKNQEVTSSILKRLKLMFIMMVKIILKPELNFTMQEWVYITLLYTFLSKLIRTFGLQLLYLQAISHLKLGCVHHEFSGVLSCLFLLVAFVLQRGRQKARPCSTNCYIGH